MKFQILIVLLYFSCAAPMETASDVDKEEVILEVQSNFSSFLKNFQKIELPISLTLNSSYWIDFSDGKGNNRVIPREEVKRYFYSNSDVELKASSFDQFYYGGLVLFSGDLIGVTFYGASKEEDGVDGYQLVLFNRKGEFKDSLLIAGTRGLFDVDMQLEAEVNDREIVLNRIELDLEKINDLNRFEGRRSYITYRINEFGSFQKEGETEYQSVLLTSREENNFRIEILE